MWDLMIAIFMPVKFRRDIEMEVAGCKRCCFFLSRDRRRCKVYVGSDDGNLLAVTSDGTLNWKFQTKGLKYSSPSLSPSGTVYVGSLDAYIYAVKPDGSLKWKFLTESVSLLSFGRFGWDGLCGVMGFPPLCDKPGREPQVEVQDRVGD